jgi:hypothetical protein
MNNEERAMMTPPNPDYRIVRGGKPGKYFFYRPAEILVRNDDAKAVAAILRPEREYDVDPNERTSQRRHKRDEYERTFGYPFDVRVYRFDPHVDGGPKTVPEALARLEERGIEAEYNYVSSRSPMRSHAVSYAEPVDLTSLTPLAMSEGPDPMRIGVLDTGRPMYEAAFMARFSAIRQEAGPVSPGSTPHDPFAEIDAIFVDRSTPPSSTTGRGGTPLPDPDQDTMVTAAGVLSHPHAGHGVFVSSIIARHAPGVRILAEATMHRDAIADLHEILVDLADAIGEPHNCKLLNMSLGFPTVDDKCPPVLESVLARLRELDVLLVASAGNDGSNRKMWPAAHKSVVAVAATDARGTPTDWSNHGGWVDACAYGNDVDSNFAFGKWLFPDGAAKQFSGAARWSGTSFAAPLVTARIANEMRPGDKALDAWTRVREAGTTKDDHGNDIPVDYGVRIVPPTK